MSHDKLAYRLVNIVARLSMGERLNIKDLSKEYQTSERTIRRDFGRLEGVLAIDKDKGGYFLAKSQMGQFNFADVSKFADLSGTKAIYPHWNLSFVNQLLDQNNHIYQIKPDAYENVAELKRTMDFIQEAISKHQELQFIYKHKKRTVKPYRLVHHGVWYLAGVENGRLKTYHISRIRHLNSQKITFIPDEAIAKQVQDEQDVWFVPSHEKITVKVRVDALVADYFRQRAILPQQELICVDDGGNLELLS